MVDNSFIYYYIIKLTKVHPGPCTCEFFDHQLTSRLDSLHYLVLRFPERPLSGLLARRDLPPYSLFPPSGAAVIYPFF